jgi:hypothetical protein
MGPVEVQYVSIQLPVIVPLGVTVQDCVVVAAAFAAVTEN